MTVFAYAGIQNGKKINGEIIATDLKDASLKLRNQKIIVIQIKQTSKKDKTPQEVPLSDAPIIFVGGNIHLNFGPFGKIPNKEIIQFTKKITTMIRAGLPILDSITMIRDQTEHAKMRSIVSQICKDLNAGVNLSDAFSKYPKVFNTVYVDMIVAGEASGKLNDFLQKLVDLQEKNQKIISGIKSALFYPITLLTVAGLITFFMLWKVVPIFVNIYKSMGADLPFATRVILKASNFISSGFNILMLLIVIFGLNYIFKFSLKKYEHFRYLVHKFQLKIPIFGNILSKSIISRMTLIMANLQAAGVGIVETLNIAKSVTDNLVFVYALNRISKKIVTGDSLSKLFTDEKEVFPAQLAQLTYVGENTGNLEDMFQSISNYYEEEFDTVVKGLTTIIEPIMIVAIGAIIGLLLVALYLPIFSIGSTIK
jgi:type IV pilus assembly protein PilC